MAGSHEKLPRVFWVQIVLVLIVGMFYLFSPSPEPHGEAEATPADTQMLAALEPIGSVEIKKDAVAPGAARAGGETVTRVCAVCHSIGLANAPKLDDGAKADWEARLAGGMNNLVQSAIKGKGGMPAKGGDPSLTDEEVYLAVSDMLNSAGLEVAPTAAEESTVSAAASAEVPVVAGRSGEDTVKSTCAVCHSIGLANAPKLEEGAKADWMARMDGDINNLVKNAINGKGAMPPRGGDPSLTDDEIHASITTMLASAGIEVSAPAVAEPVEVVVSNKGQAAESGMAVITASELGQSTYKASCFACHDTGAANAPVFGDKLAWKPRLSAGAEALYASALNGKGAMPAKGGNPSLTDEAVVEAVKYMIENVQ